MKIALIGNQNCGKTTLFNTLTGTNQKVGNWPGVTIERKEGTIKGTDLTVVDLPGVYSLSPYTSEEKVSRDYILSAKPDLIINIVDATSIERSLYLTTQLLELDSKVIVVLNMADQLERKGITIDTDILEKALHTKVLKISALKNIGIKELITEIENSDSLKKEYNFIFPKKIEEAITLFKLEDNRRFKAFKAFENDPEYKDYLNEDIIAVRDSLEKEYGTEMDQILANERYNYISKVKDMCFKQIELRVSITDKVDKVLLNKWAAIPIFILIMALIYFLSVGLVGGYTVDLVDGLFSDLSNAVSNGLEKLNASDWAISLICDGIISGVGAVLNFVPQLIILFLCISILETSGYMSRIAFFLDRLFHKFGLSGKSLIPFIVGSGCSVPGIMTARTIEDEAEKRITIMTTPFIPCSAKLPIIALFAGYFFDAYSGLVTVSLYFLAIVIILLSSIIIKKFFIKQNNSAFISELPEYKLPSLKYILRDVFDKTWAFIKRAGTIILFCSIIIWFLLSFGWDFWNGMVTDVSDSILASIGNLLSWVFYPILGEFSWAATVSAIQGLVAKEQVVSSMNIIAGLAEDSNSASSLFTSPIFSFFSGPSAYAYCVFCLFSAPCFGAIGAMRRELGSSKKMWQAVLFQTGVAWTLAVIVFLIGKLIVTLF